MRIILIMARRQSKGRGEISGKKAVALGTAIAGIGFTSAVLLARRAAGSPPPPLPPPELPPDSVLTTITLQLSDTVTGIDEPVSAEAAALDQYGNSLPGIEIIFTINDAVAGVATTGNDGKAGLDDIRAPNEGEFVIVASDSTNAISSPEMTLTIVPNPTPPPRNMPLPTALRTIRVTSLGAMFNAVSAALPGDHIVLANGTYNNGVRTPLTKDATAASPIVVRAETIGSVTITGAPIDISGDNLIFHGFRLRYTAAGDAIFIRGAGVRFARNDVQLVNQAGVQSEWLTVLADNCIIDHNYFALKETNGTFLLVGTGGAVVKNTLVRRNSFYDHRGVGTPAEAIRFGSSQTANVSFNCILEENRFERINGETELITIKCSGCTLARNTFINCNSSMTFRHGQRHTALDNTFLRCGFRIYGSNHTVRGNQMIGDPNNQLRGHMVPGAGTHARDGDSLAGAPFADEVVLPAGHENHAQVKNSMFEQNILAAESATALTVFAWAYNSNPVTYPPNYLPVGNTVRQNIITGSRGRLANSTWAVAGVSWGPCWIGNTVTGNILYPTGTATLGDMPASGFQQVDPLLQKGSDGIYRFTTNSPLRWVQNNFVLRTVDVGPYSQ